MPDYQKGKIYQIVCYETNERYVGSTTQPLSKRLHEHTLKTKIGYSSYDIITRGNYQIELIEEYPCDTKQQLNRKEGETIRRLRDEGYTVVNKRLPGRTQQEYNKYYWKTEQGRKNLSKGAMKWYNKNKETINEKLRLRRLMNKQNL